MDAPWPITACLLARDEADRIGPTLRALQGKVARILVVDSGSLDATPALARDLGAEVLERPWAGYVEGRQFLLEQAATPWVLMLDADEVIPPEWFAELAGTGFPAVTWNGAESRRETVYLGRRMRFAWQPDRKLFLFRRDAARVAGGAVHETVAVPAPVIRLQTAVAHYSYRSLGDHVQRIHRYAALGAEDLGARGVRVGWSDLVLRPIWHMFRQLFIRRAWRDGIRGWLAAASAGYSVWLRYALAWEQQHAPPPSGADD